MNRCDLCEASTSVLVSHCIPATEECEARVLCDSCLKDINLYLKDGHVYD